MVSFKADVPVDYNNMALQQLQTMPEQQPQLPAVDMTQYPDTFEMTQPYGQFEEQPKKGGVLVPLLLTGAAALGTFFLGKHFGAKGAKGTSEATDAVKKELEEAKNTIADQLKKLEEAKNTIADQLKKIENLAKENKTLKEIKDKASEIANKNMSFMDTVTGEVNKRIKQLRDLFKSAEDKAKKAAKNAGDAKGDAMPKAGDAAKKGEDAAKGA